MLNPPIMDENHAIVITPDWKKQLHRFAHRAMATHFEIYTTHSDKDYAQQAAREAFAELDRLERELSRFVPGSDVSRINLTKPGEEVRIGLETFECLQYAQRIFEQTHGCFDVTLGQPYFILNEANHTFAWIEKSGRVDLGGIGKGYAIDQMAKLLREWDVSDVLIHGGFSTVLAMDSPRDAKGWPVTISHPRSGNVLKRIALENVSLSGSGIRKTDHIIDPQTGEPIRDRIGAWCMAFYATETDALSTAAMIMPPEEIESYCEKHSNKPFFILSPENDLLEYEQI